MRVRFLLDVDVQLAYVHELQRYDPTIDVVRINQPGALVLNPIDYDLWTERDERKQAERARVIEILHYCEQAQCAFVGEYYSLMPPDEQAYFATGGHHWGIFKLRKGFSVGACLADLQAIWEASTAEEWIDVSSWLPLSI